MTNPPSASGPPSAFGRATQQSRDRARNPPPLPAKRRGATAPLPAGPAGDDLAQELAAWKRTRQRTPFPWRQISLVLGLCFAGASRVLPTTVNDGASYVLYALAGISFLSGLARRR